MNKTSFDDLPWEEIQEMSEKGIFEEVFKKIPKERFRFAAQEENKEALITSAFKRLQKDNPHASREQAELLAGLMQQFAQRILEG